MAEKKPRTRTYCADPYKAHKKKALRDRTFTLLTETYMETKSDIPELVQAWDSGERYICKLCAWRVERNLAKLQKVNESLKSLKLSSESSEDEESDGEPYFEDKATELELLSSQLAKIGVEGKSLTDRYVSKETVKFIIGEIEEKFISLKSKVETLTGFTAKLEQKTTIKSECKSCPRLLSQLKNAFSKACTTQDKYKILTCIPKSYTIAEVTELFQCSQHMARKASKLKNSIGAFTCPEPKVGRKMDPELVKLVKEFYLSDENSRVDPSSRSTIMVYDNQLGERVRKAKRLVLTSLSDLYAEFLKFYPTLSISISSFAILRPKWCNFPGKRGFHETCTCISHENFNLMLYALKGKIDPKQFLNSLVCSPDREECAFGVCSACPNESLISEVIENFLDEEITFHYWGTMKGTYGINIHEKTENINFFSERLSNYVSLITSHHFIMKKQMAYIETLKKDILPSGNFALLQVDFAQNYAYVVQGSVQGYHWNNNQATVHPFVLTFFDKLKHQLVSNSYVVISDELSHDAFSFHAFREHVMNQIKNEGHHFEMIYYLSDGAGAQYKNKWNFANLLFHEEDFGIKAQWHFHATSHGKSQCDAIGAVVKRLCRMASLNADPISKQVIYIRNVAEMAKFAAEKLRSQNIKILTVYAGAIKDSKARLNDLGRFAGVKTLDGTRAFHSFVPFSTSAMTVRRSSLSLKFQTVALYNQPEPVISIFANGNFVGVRIGSMFTVGLIVSYSDEGGYEVNLLRRQAGGNSFIFPERENVQHFTQSEILLTVAEPTCNKTGRVHRLSQADYKKLENLSHN